MSYEFFSRMEKIEKLIHDLKFLENSHPEISNDFIPISEKLLLDVEKLDKDLRKYLTKLHGPKKLRKKKENG